MFKRFTATCCACFVLAFAGTGMAASYTDKANGDYNDPNTWNEGGNPGGGSIADNVTIDSHEVTMTVAGDGSNDTITVKSGGTLRGVNTVVGLLVGSAIDLDGGLLYLGWNSDQSYRGGDVRVVSDSFIQMRGGNRSFTEIESLELLDGATLSVNHWDQYLGVAGTLQMSGDATIQVEQTSLSFPMELSSISGTGTLTKVGSSEALAFTGPATNFSGGLIVGEGYVHLDAANALQGSKPISIASNATLQSRAGYALDGRTVHVPTGATIRTSQKTAAYKNCTILLEGGTNSINGAPSDYRPPGGDVRVTGNSMIFVHGGNIRLCDIDSLEICEGAYLSVRLDDHRLGVAGTMLISGSATLDIFATAFWGPMEVRVMNSVACGTLIKKGDEDLKIHDTMGIRLQGNADLIPSNSYMIVTNAAGTITDNTTWEDSTMWTKGGSAATAITATLNPAANKGTIDNGHGSVSFASSDLGYVTVEGLRSGGGANARLVIMEFDSPSDLDGIQAKLEAAHPDWYKFFQKGGNKIGFTLEPTIDGTGYFGWDNKHGDLGANVLSIWFGPPDRGTVVLVF